MEGVESAIFFCAMKEARIFSFLGVNGAAGWSCFFEFEGGTLRSFRGVVGGCVDADVGDSVWGDGVGDFVGVSYGMNSYYCKVGN